MSTVKPETFKLQQEYEQTVEKTKQDQMNAHATRVQQNKEKALIQTKKLLVEYKRMQQDEETKKEQAAASNSFYVPKEPAFFLVVRIRGMNRVPPTERKALDLLRLRKPNTAVLITNNHSTRKTLQIVRNYVAFGYISLELLRELVYKRGFCKVNGEVYNLTNEIIEDTFGDLMCVEDLISELWMNKSRSKEVNRFLAPFRLNCPRGGFKGKKSKDFMLGGSCGNHFELIEDLVKRMIN